MINLQIFSKKKSTLLAVYDLEKINCSFDFMTFFQNAKLYQKKNNFDKLDLCIIKGSENGFKKQQFNREKNNKLDNAMFRLNYIVIPMVMMFRKHYENFYLIEDRNEAKSFLDNYKNFFPQIFESSGLKSNKNIFCRQSVWGRLEEDYKNVELVKLEVQELLAKKLLNKLDHTKKIISITLREGSYHEHRNSLLDEWKNFILYLEKNNYIVIVIRDAEKAYLDNLFEKNNIFPHASHDLYLRTAIYKISYFNYFVAGGPAVICWSNGYKSASFKFWYTDEKSKAVEENTSIPRNHQSKILNKSNHFLLSELDTVENLINFHKKNLLI